MEKAFKYDKIEDVEKKVDDILKSMAPKKEEKTFIVWGLNSKGVEKFDKAVKDYINHGK